MKKKLIAILMVLIYLFSLTASASSVKDVLSGELEEELNYMDDVYKYDLSLSAGKENEVEEEIPRETLKYERAVNTAVALELIPMLSDGTFSEDTILSVEEFSKIAEVFKGDSSEYASLSAVTHKIAVLMLMKALGYDFIEKEEWAIQQAYSNKIIKGFTYNQEKHISRGEMAQLLYNALNSNVVNMVTIGLESKYEKSDISLLYRTFQMIEIEGLVTAANGLDIYANRVVDKNTIEIDRAAYYKGNVDTSGLFGQRVYGLIKADGSDSSTIHFLKKDTDISSVTISFDKIVSAGDTVVYETSDGRKSLNASGVKYVVLNGNTAMGPLKINNILNGEGEITFSSTEKYGNYDIAIINKYESFKVNRVSSIDEKLFFDDGLKYNDSESISLREKRDMCINIIKNGEKATALDIKAGDAVSIFSWGNNYVQIEVSDKYISGEIGSLSDDKVIIGDIEYSVSPAYEKARRGGAKLSVLAPGVKGKFLLSSFGSIVSLDDNESAYVYGILKAYGQKASSGISAQMEARILTADTEWMNYDFAKKVTIDGKKGMDAAEVMDYLLPYKDELSSSIIRYKLNSDDEIVALDTVKEKAEEEADPEHLVKSGEWHSSSGINLDWRKGLNLRNSTYSVTKDAVIFYIPEDKEDETEYQVLKQSDLIPETPADLFFYNADEYFRSGVVVFSGETGGGNFINTEQYLVTSIAHSNDKNGNEIFILNGLLSVLTEANRGWNPQKYTTTAQIAKKYPDLKSGDLIQVSRDTNGRVNAISKLVGVEGLPSGSTDVNNTIGYDERTYGTVVSVEPETGMMLVERINGTNKELCSFEVRVTAIYDSATRTGTNASLGDVNPGDTVYLRGGYRLVNAVIYR